MSLILDALNRADRERKSTRVTPDLNTIHEAAHYPVNSPRRQQLIIVAALALALLLLWLVYPLLQNRLASAELPQVMSKQNITAQADIRPRQRTEAAPRATSEVQKVPANSAAISTVAPQKAPQDSADAAEISTLYTQEDAPQPRATTPVVAASQKAPESQINDLYKPVEESANIESVAIPVQTVTPVRLGNSEKETGKPLEAYHNVPDLSQLPTSIQQKIPSLRYTQHNYSAEGASSVVLNGRSHTARTSIAPELSLEQILPDGILLRYQDRQFKLRALNHWINM